MRFPGSMLSAALALSTLVSVPVGAVHADENTPPGPVPVAIDATHFLVVRGDRVVIYAVDPDRGYSLRVINTALLDENGMIVGQFRPAAKPTDVTPPPAKPRPALPAPANPEPSATPAVDAVRHSPDTGGGSQSECRAAATL